MLYFKPSPGPPPISKPPWIHRRLAITVTKWLAFATITGFVTYQFVFVFNYVRNVNWPDPATFPIKNVTNRVDNAGLPVTVKRLIYIDQDDNTYVFAGVIKPNSWLAKQVKPDGKFRELDLEDFKNTSVVNLALALHRPKEMPVFAITNSDRNQELRDRMARNSK